MGKKTKWEEKPAFEPGFRGKQVQISGNPTYFMSKKPLDIKSSVVGTMVQFANKKWIVADVDAQGNMILMWQDAELTGGTGLQFNTTGDAGVGNAWANSPIRVYLNDTTNASNFLQGVLGITNFTTAPYTDIIDYTCDGESYNPDGNMTAKTVDKVWLMSINEFDRNPFDIWINLTSEEKAALIKNYCVAEESISSEKGIWLRSPDDKGWNAGWKITTTGKWDTTDVEITKHYGILPFVKVKPGTVSTVN